MNVAKEIQDACTREESTLALAENLSSQLGSSRKISE